MLMQDGGDFRGSQRFAILAIIFLLCSLSTSFLQPVHAVEAPYEAVEICDYVEQLEFNGTLANESVHWQTSLGPRVPGTNASETFRNSVEENLTQWNVSMHEYTVDDLTFTNVEAVLEPVGADNNTPRIVLVAHYDTRNVAERDSDENRTNEPIIGANDGASGAAALLELARIIPPMELNYEVELLFTDAEDQNYTPHRFFGAEKWAEDQTPQEINRTAAFIVLDMIGDADLQLTHIWPGNGALWSTIPPLAEALGMVENKTDCNGEIGVKIFDQNTSIGVYDDHVPALNIGIRAIDLIDIRFGPGAQAFGGYWHTHEDTPDKVSAESLGTVGRMVELGLRSGAWLVSNSTQEEPTEPLNSSENEDDIKEEIETQTYPLFALVAALSVGSLLLLMLFLGWNIRKQS